MTPEIEYLIYLIPVITILAGIIITVSSFILIYFKEKGKQETIVEISKNMDDPSRLEDLINILEDSKKKEPLDYRRTGVISVFVGLGLFLLGFVALGVILEGVGLLVGAIGVGQIIAGYLYPNTSEELTDAVEKFEER
ncbi:MAG: hypothetical protein CMQ30_08450 [Gammaproteobacteria bacterium]|nr:hypothetical protein [Gammaproteobacteria bacterium]|tara:strand:- start:299 stop:712 length:414 start_codon:yes stop_codon:yes gene_type:complete